MVVLYIARLAAWSGQIGQHITLGEVFHEWDGFSTSFYLSGRRRPQRRARPSSIGRRADATSVTEAAVAGALILGKTNLNVFVERAVAQHQIRKGVSASLRTAVSDARASLGPLPRLLQPRITIPICLCD